MNNIIEKAKQGWPIETRPPGVTFEDAWRKAHFVGLSKAGYPVIQIDGEVHIRSVTDIRLAKKKMIGWVNVYPTSKGLTMAGRAQQGHIFLTQSQADQWAAYFEGRIACVKVEWEEEPKND